ncbi:MAG: 4Fe-4S binding protein [Deltaproteobacteria bacterium]|nr:4Fe-4S binding protein [Deltaproteobacteria bacterium]
MQATGSGLLLAVAGGIAGCGADERRGVILSDPRLCGACARCAITCSSLNAGGPGVAQALVGPEPHYQAHQFTDGGWYAATCRMCPVTNDDGHQVSPACITACEVGAAQIAPPGHPVFGDTQVRFIDQDRCIGCGSCTQACPFSHPLLEAGVARKCELCIGRWGAPPCVEACPSCALLYFADWRDAVPAIFPWQNDLLPTEAT